MSGADLLSHLGAAALVLVDSLRLLRRGWIGGGDAKLAAATALWLGFDHLFDYLIYASLLGGALTLLIVQFRAMPLPRLLAGQEWAERLHQRGRRRALRHCARRGRASGLSADRVDASIGR